MTRPAIIIGLGGTGQWILTYLKKDLLEIGNGQIPDGVKLLCFDTTTKPMALVGKVGDDGKVSEAEVKLGSVRLDPGTEFIPIGDNVYNLARSVRDGQEDPSKQKHPHIASWFDADDLLRRHASMTFNLAEGSGQIRSFGRIAIFNDLLNGPNSKIRAHLQLALRKLQKDVSDTRQLEIIIISSFAGGTGAGMFVDMGILARKEASKLVEKNLCVRGFYVLPRVFTAQNTEMQARAFAAWRELDRFLMIGQKFGQRKMIYNPTDPDLQIKINERIFDVCYLVDAVGEGKNSFDKLPPEQGLFPMVSDVISTILDSQAGQKYTEYITSNLAGKLDRLPRAPYHSVIGAYTIKVPVYFDLQVYAHQFALDILDRFLRPIKDVERKQVVGVANDANEEKPNYSGKRAALEFLRSQSSKDFGSLDTEVFNTSFPHVVADLWDKEAYNDKAVIKRIALMNLAAGQGVEQSNIYLGALTNLAADETGKKLKSEVESELNLLLTKEVPPSRVAKDAPGPAISRVEKKTSIFINEHYGTKLSDGTERRGKYGDALQKCRSFQVKRFRDMLYIWMSVTLNGTVDDVERAKGGKLGYVRDALQEIRASMGKFIEFFNNVRAERTESLAKLNLDAAANNALAYYKRHGNDKCWLCAWDAFIHPRAHMSQIAYLQAEQVKIAHRKYDILLNALIETADDMRTIAENATAEMDNWVDYLATGNPEQQIDSLYRSVQNSLDMAEANHSLDKRLDKVQRILGEQPYQANSDKVKATLGRLQWVVSLSDGLPKVGLKVAIPQKDGKPTYSEFRSGGETATSENLRLILSLGEAQYSDLPEQAPVAKLLMDAYPSADVLADSVNGWAEPLYEAGTEGKSAPQMVSCYVRVNTTSFNQERARGDEYFQKMVDKLNALHPMAVESEYEVLPSDNKYRMTIMRTDDLLLSEAFNMRKICLDAYKQLAVQQGVPVSRFQTYPAERNAALYEQEIYKVLKPDGGYRILHPLVVALLEDKSSIEYFFWCLAYGFIRKDRNGTQDVYIFELPGKHKAIHLSRIFDDPMQYKSPDFLDVIDVFVNKGSAIDNDQLYIDMVDVRKAVQARMNEIGVDGAIERLQFQLDNPTGIVNTLLQKVEKDREGKSPSEKPSISAEYEDLADLAKVIYKRQIETLRGS